MACARKIWNPVLSLPAGCAAGSAFVSDSVRTRVRAGDGPEV
jgi:hypothetical protein